MMQMTCPKCRGDMRQYERSGVTVDQCTECRGIFLDRGELEKLFEAEANWSQQQSPARPAAAPGAGYPPPPPPPPPAHQPGYGGPSHAPPPPPPPPGHGYPPAPAYGQPHYGYHGHYRHKKRKSFLNEFFD
ncbi:zf-TFIIB domain-containing protein [Plantactinospora sp. WMMB334]|uniref:TFIIB-type zinc ribbon-containing protein n=1 Tax=Plantactinospora sp. WMMB334 TaxID=3404119 RepID=UPI003B960793